VISDENKNSCNVILLLHIIYIIAHLNKCYRVNGWKVLVVYQLTKANTMFVLTLTCL